MKTLIEETCNQIWDEIVLATFNEMFKKNAGIICPEYEKEAFYVHYEDVIKHAKEQYMSNKESVLNRHKVSAALMIAILKTKPIKKVDPMYYQTNANGDVVHWTFNESLAITVALSVLRAFILSRVDYAFSGKAISKAVFADVTKEDKDIFENGIPISDQDREDWEWELYQVRQDGAYNLLAIAHILKEIERNCRLEYFLKNNKKPTYPDPKNLTDKSNEIQSLDEIIGNK